MIDVVFIPSNPNEDVYRAQAATTREALMRRYLTVSVLVQESLLNLHSSARAVISGAVVNQRATSVLWAIRPPMRGLHVLRGPVAVTSMHGQPDPVLQGMASRGTYRLAHRAFLGSAEWQVDDESFSDWFSVLEYGFRGMRSGHWSAEEELSVRTV